jgi:hypothetical protein
MPFILIDELTLEPLYQARLEDLVILVLTLNWAPRKRKVSERYHDVKRI